MDRRQTQFAHAVTCSAPKARLATTVLLVPALQQSAHTGGAPAGGCICGNNGAKCDQYYTCTPATGTCAPPAPPPCIHGSPATGVCTCKRVQCVKGQTCDDSNYGVCSPVSCPFMVKDSDDDLRYQRPDLQHGLHVLSALKNVHASSSSCLQVRIARKFRLSLQGQGVREGPDLH